MTLQELRNYIKTRYATDLSDVEIDAHINEVYGDISKLFTPDTTEEDETLSTVDTQEHYTMPVATRAIKQVHLTDGDGDRVRLRSMKADAVLYPRSSGEPKRWYPYGFKEDESANVRQQFGLDPVPNTANASLTLHVLYEPEASSMEENTDVPEYVPEELHYLIAWGALALAAGKQEDYNTSQYWEAKYRSAYNDMLAKLGKSSQANFPEASKQVKG